MFRQEDSSTILTSLVVELMASSHVSGMLALGLKER